MVSNSPLSPGIAQKNIDLQTNGDFRLEKVKTPLQKQLESRAPPETQEVVAMGVTW